MLRLRSERGATAMIVAGSLMLVMGMAAVALDVGMGFSERRQAQTGADFGALAALQGAGYDSCTGSSCNPVTARNEGAAEAIEVVEANLGKTLDWASCTDPDPLPHQSGTTGCVSFTTNFDEARVHIPDDVIDTTFGRVVGRDTLTIQGEAAAEQRLNQRGTVLPFYAVTPVGSSHLCLFSNQPSQSVPPCHGANAGNFGSLDVRLYGNDELGTTTSCNGNAGTRLEWNISVGADHNLRVRGADPQVRDDGACPNRSADVNALQTQPGSGGASSGPIERGLAGPTASPAGPRLACGPTSYTDIVRGACLDDTPLWYFLDQPCPASAGGWTPDDREQMEACLDAWRSGTISGVLFDADIVDHPRFAQIPVLHTSPSGAGIGNIVAFQPVYLETSYISNCSGGGGGGGIPCQTVFSPGETGDGDVCDDAALTNCGHSEGSRDLSHASVTVEALTGLALESGMLPASVRDQLAGSAGTREMLLYE